MILENLSFLRMLVSFRGESNFHETEWPFRGNWMSTKLVLGSELCVREKPGLMYLHNHETDFGFGNVVRKHRPKYCFKKKNLKNEISFVKTHF